MAERTPLLLLPGLLCDAGLWAPQAEALADVAEVQVADLTQDDRVEAMAARVLAQAPARFALAGLSMGGYVAFEILRQEPGARPGRIVDHVLAALRQHAGLTGRTDDITLIVMRVGDRAGSGNMVGAI